MPYRGEAGGVQLLVLSDAARDALLWRLHRRSRQRDERFRRVHELAVEAPIRVAGNPAALGFARHLVDLPLRERRGVEDVLVAAADEHYRVLRGRAIEIVAKRQPLFFELRL